MKNNRGTSLAELLAVVVVMGIIAAIAIPLVGKVIDKTRLKSIYGDAVALRDAARLYCNVESYSSDFCKGIVGATIPSDLSKHISNSKYQKVETGNSTTDEYRFSLLSSGTGEFYIEIQNNKYTYKGNPSIHKIDGGCYVAETNEANQVGIIAGASYFDYMDAFLGDYCLPTLINIDIDSLPSQNGSIDKVFQGSINIEDAIKVDMGTGGIQIKDDVRADFAEMLKNLGIKKRVPAHDGSLDSTNPEENYVLVGEYTIKDVSNKNIQDDKDKQVSIYVNPIKTTSGNTTTITDTIYFEVDMHYDDPKYGADGIISGDILSPFGFKIKIDVEYKTTGLTGTFTWDGGFIDYSSNYDSDNSLYFKNNKVTSDGQKLLDAVVHTYLRCVIGVNE